MNTEGCQDKSIKSSSIIFKLPIQGIYITDKGSLQSFLLPDQTLTAWKPDVVDFQADFALNVGGIELQTLGGDYSSPDLTDILGLSKDVKDTLHLASQAFAALSGAIAVVNAIPSALRFVGLLAEEENPFNVLFGRIDQKLSIILKATLSGNKLSTEQGIADLLGHSETSAKFAADHIDKGYPENQTAIQRLINADYWSSYAVTTLAKEPYWRRTYDEYAFQQTAPYQWMSGIKDRAEIIDNTVWDYRLTLPALLKAIIARLVVIKALDPSHHINGSYRNEILGYAEILRKIEERIRSGLARAALPISSEHYPFMAKWRSWPCGVADLHSGLSDYRDFYPWSPSDEIEAMEVARFGYPNNFEEYIALYASITELRFWRLYKWIGGFSFWQITPDLESLAGPKLNITIWEKVKIRKQIFEIAPAFPRMLTRLYN